MQLLMKSFEFSFSQRKHIDSMMGFMCYYGHVQNTSNLGEGNVYKSYFLGALVEIPCWLVTEISLSLHVCFFSVLILKYRFLQSVQVCSIYHCQDVTAFCHFVIYSILFFSQVCPIHNRQDGSTLAPSLPIHVLRHLWSCLRLHSWWPAEVKKFVILSTLRTINYKTPCPGC